MGRWWRYKWITFHPSLTCQHNLCNMFNFIHTFTTIEGI
ncbi:transferase [Salmonella enterica subsp. enterica serovar Schwarzengrund]|nr:transferase [Salmonella enterica subsp. enterica serovar Schwarzengrund]